jgi:hypothetical protein
MVKVDGNTIPLSALDQRLQDLKISQSLFRTLLRVSFTLLDALRPGEHFLLHAAMLILGFLNLALCFSLRLDSDQPFERLHNDFATFTSNHPFVASSHGAEADRQSSLAAVLQPHSRICSVNRRQVALVLRRESAKACSFRLASQQAPHACDEMHATVEQEPALVLWRFPPGGLDVLGALLDARLHAHAEVQDFAELFDALGTTSVKIESVWGGEKGIYGSYLNALK